MSEKTDYIERKLRKPAFLEKIKYKRKILSLRNADINRMRKVLVDEAKPIFISNFLGSKKGSDAFYRLVEYYFDERIMTLPKKSLYELYTSYSELKESKGKAYEEYTLMDFVTLASLLYSLNGWFRNKMFLFIQKGLV